MKLFEIIIVTFLILGMFGGSIITPTLAAEIQFDEFQITTNTSSQTQPDIYLYWIVYQDNRNGNWDIYLYTVQGAIDPEERVTTNPANQMEPAIDGEIVVYQDDRNGNWDIYMYNVLTKTETRITTNTASQQYPDIYHDRIVWEDNRNGHLEIYMYDLTTKTETRITNSLANRNPAISGNIITYEKQVFQNNAYRWSIYYFDLATNVETQVSDGNKYEPAIDGSLIVYQAQFVSFDYYTSYKVVMKDVVSGTTWESEHPTEQKNPDVSGNIIVYEDNRVFVGYPFTDGYRWSIFLYNLDTQIESQVTKLTPNGGNQVSPAIDGGRIVYMDDRNGNSDIYMTMVSFAQSAPSDRTLLGAAGPDTDNLPLVGAVGPENVDTQSESDNLFPRINDLFILVVILVIVVLDASLSILGYYKKQKNRTFNKENT